MPGSNPDRACRPSHSEFSVFFSETRVNTGQDPLERPPSRRALHPQAQIPCETIGLKINHQPTNQHFMVSELCMKNSLKIHIDFFFFFFYLFVIFCAIKLCHTYFCLHLQIFFNVMTASMFIGQTAPYFEAFALARGAAAKIYSIIDRVNI